MQIGQNRQQQVQAWNNRSNLQIAVASRYPNPDSPSLQLLEYFGQVHLSKPAAPVLS